MSHGIRFSHGGREWFAYPVVNEANTRVLTLVKPVAKGRPFPTNAEYRAAREYYGRITSDVSPPARLRVVE